MGRRISILVTAIILSITNSAHASLDGKEDYSVSRVVAVSTSEQVTSSPWVNGSGYLYSPRIVFSAGHLKDHNPSGIFYVSQPNKKIISGMESVKVVKAIYPSNYIQKIYSNDFAIFILEKPLAQVETAPLVTPEILSTAIASKSPMKIVGFGAFEDVCQLQKQTAPCPFGSERTSLVPRSIGMVPSNASEVERKFHQSDERIADHLFLTGPHKSGPCGGDSGGPTIATVNGTDYYVGTVPTGFWNAYACGQSPGYEGETIGWTAPVYKFVDLIAEAEKFVSEHPYAAPKISPFPTKAQLKDVVELAKKWALTSRSTDTPSKQCRSARDKGLIYKSGKPIPLGSKAQSIRAILKTTSGFQACLDGFTR